MRWAWLLGVQHLNTHPTLAAHAARSGHQGHITCIPVLSCTHEQMESPIRFGTPR